MAVLKGNPILHIAILVPASDKEQNRQRPKLKKNENKKLTILIVN